MSAVHLLDDYLIFNKLNLSFDINLEKLFLNYEFDINYLVSEYIMWNFHQIWEN
jgi:hypothetical protein